jgi:ribosomal-protein-alanine N-acetyltransferase
MMKLTLPSDIVLAHEEIKPIAAHYIRSKSMLELATFELKELNHLRRITDTYGVSYSERYGDAVADKSHILTKKSFSFLQEELEVLDGVRPLRNRIGAAFDKCWSEIRSIEFEDTKDALVRMRGINRLLNHSFDLDNRIELKSEKKIAEIEKLPKTLVNLRWLIRRDFPEVLEIARDASTFPSNEKELISCLRSRTCIGKVAEYGNRIVGFFIYHLGKLRVHLDCFAVAEDMRRGGVGGQIVNNLSQKIAYGRRKFLTTDADESCDLGHRLLKKKGFSGKAVLPNFIENTGADAYWMLKSA